MADVHEMDATLHAAQWWHDRLSLMGKSTVVEVHPAEAQALDKTISGLLAIIAGQSREITQLMDERQAALPPGFTIEFRPKQRDSTEPSVWRVTATGFIATEYSYANAVRRAWTQALLDSKENKG